MSRRSIFSSILNFTVAGLCVVLSGCGLMDDNDEGQSAPVVTQPQKMPIKSTIQRKHKVALLVPLSGLHAETGYSLQRAAEMGLFEHPDDNMELVIKDTYGTAEGASKAADEALAEKVELIVGPLLSYEVSAVAARTRGRVPVLAFSNNRAVAANSVFIMGYAPADQIERLCNFAVGQGITDIAVVVPQNEYGSLVTAVFESLNNKKLINVTSYVTYNPDQPNEMTMTAEITGNGIFFAEVGYPLIQAMDTLQNHGINFNHYKLLGISQWDDQQTLLNTRLTGAYYVNCDTVNRIDFEHKFEMNYKAKPFKITSFGYDAISMVAALIKLDGNRPFKIEDLTQEKGFAGVDGLFRLNKNGYVERGLAIYEVTGHESEMVDPAPSHF